MFSLLVNFQPEKIMYRYIPPKERRHFHFGKNISIKGLVLSIVLMFSLVSLISAVQMSFNKTAATKASTVLQENSNQDDSLTTGNVIGKKASKKEMEQAKLLSVPVILQNLPLERNWPIRGRITTNYSSYHQGLDIANSLGTPIHPFASGVVVARGWQGSFGNAVTIVHNNGYASTYAHMSKISTTVGQQVDIASEVGLVGSTGRSTGPHLHFQLTLFGKTVNPLGALP